MTDRELRMVLLDKSQGDVEKAKAMYEWLMAQVLPPEPPMLPDGVTVFDAEILCNDADALQAIAMRRLADRQNGSAPAAPPAPAPEPEV